MSLEEGFIPNAPTILKFRHFPGEHDLTGEMFSVVDVGGEDIFGHNGTKSTNKDQCWQQRAIATMSEPRAIATG